MAVHAQVEAAKSVTRKTVTTALQDDSLWPIVCHNSLDDGLEDVAVCVVGDAVAKREVDRVVFAAADTNVA